MVKKHHKSAPKPAASKSRVTKKADRPSESSAEERRQYDRYETALKIQFYVNFDLETKIDFRVMQNDKSDFSKETYTAFSKNVSVEGICFYTDKELNKGDLLLLDVYIPSAADPVKMQGQVRWSSRYKGTGPKGLYETGVKLLSVNNEIVEKTIFMDEVHHIAWSVVLESVFGNFKHLALRRKKIN